MKKFQFHLLLPIVLLCAVGLAGLECWLRHTPTDFECRAEYMHKHASELRVLVLGSSNTAMAIKPSLLGMGPAYNLAWVSQPLYIDSLLLDRWADSLRSLQYVVLDLSYREMWFNPMHEHGDSRHYAINYGLHEMRHSPSWRDHFEVFNRNWVLQLGKDKVHCTDSDGYMRHYYIDFGYNENRFREFAARHVVSHTFIDAPNADSLYTANLSLLRHIIERIHSLGAEAVMVTCPIHFTERELYNSRQLSALHAAIDTVLHEFPSAIYLDFMDFDDDGTHFYNVNHLNPRGAELFTSVFADSLRHRQPRHQPFE